MGSAGIPTAIPAPYKHSLPPRFNVTIKGPGLFEEYENFPMPDEVRVWSGGGGGSSSSK